MDESEITDRLCQILTEAWLSNQVNEEQYDEMYKYLEEKQDDQDHTRV